MQEYQLQPCVFVSKALFDETLRTPSSLGKRLLEPLKSFAAREKLPFNILEDREVSNEAEVHRHESDLWYCMEGKVTFVYGGELVEPWAKSLPDGGVDDREIKAREIRGGTEQVPMADDWLWIPAGVPHQHTCPGTARLVIIKISKLP